MSHFGIEAGDMTPDEMHGRIPNERVVICRDCEETMSAIGRFYLCGNDGCTRYALPCFHVVYDKGYITAEYDSFCDDDAGRRSDAAGDEPRWCGSGRSDDEMASGGAP